MKSKTYFLGLFIIFSFCMCNKKENKVTNSPSTQTEKTTYKEPITPADSAKYVNAYIDVKGDVEFPLYLNVDSLKLMKTKQISNFKVVCKSGDVKKDDKNCKGVLLRDILEKAKIKQNGHKDRNFYIVARASDGYMVTFSWAEIFNNPTGENVFVLFEENNKPVKNGDMILICKNDIKTGPRHVYWLKSIEVHRVL